MNSFKQNIFDNFHLYAVTAVRRSDTGILDKIDAAYRGGADIVQLRSKELTDLELYNLGRQIKTIAARHQKLFFINDRLDLALAVEADGLHIGQDDIPVHTVRQICRAFGRELFLGKSTHSLEQALAAAGEEVDYIGVGPVYGTPTKPDTVPVGENLVAQAAPRLKIPFVAIGGIDHHNIEQVIKAGATRVAVVRAIFDAEDPYEAAKSLSGKIHAFCG